MFMKCDVFIPGIFNSPGLDQYGEKVMNFALVIRGDHVKSCSG